MTDYESHLADLYGITTVAVKNHVMWLLSQKLETPWYSKEFVPPSVERMAGEIAIAFTCDDKDFFTPSTIIEKAFLADSEGRRNLFVLAMSLKAHDEEFQQDLNENCSVACQIAIAEFIVEAFATLYTTSEDDYQMKYTLQ